ncbi:MAG: DUF2807 domain-containing protein [Acidimicrobiia bacterium]|nr:DUF2807 domain-containing protein [Acidimicrobiia bacterium]
MRTFILLLATVLVISGCNEIIGTGRVDGDGTIVTVSRDVGSFDRFELVGEGDVFLEEGPDWSLTIECDENLLEYIETNADSDSLRINTKRGYDIEPTQTPIYRVTTPSITSLALSGVGDIDLPRTSATSFSISLSGVGDIRVGVLTPNTLDVELSGVGDIDVGGTAGTQTVRLTGVGNYDATDLATADTTVTSTGTADAVVWVTDTLDVDLTGVGDVAFFGSPTVTIEDTGPGDVVPLGEK